MVSCWFTVVESVKSHQPNKHKFITCWWVSIPLVCLGSTETAGNLVFFFCNSVLQCTKPPLTGNQPNTSQTTWKSSSKCFSREKTPPQPKTNSTLNSHSSITNPLPHLFFFRKTPGWNFSLGLSSSSKYSKSNSNIPPTPWLVHTRKLHLLVWIDVFHTGLSVTAQREQPLQVLCSGTDVSYTADFCLVRAKKSLLFMAL